MSNHPLTRSPDPPRSEPRPRPLDPPLSPLSAAGSGQRNKPSASAPHVHALPAAPDRPPNRRTDHRVSKGGTLMWPWTHLAFGYLLVSLLWRLRSHRVDGAVAVATALGTQFPDLVDKPLAWGLGVLPAGRSLAHSLVTAVTVSAVVLAVGARGDRHDLALAFVVGYGSHLAGDVIPKLPIDDFDSLTFLLWPLLPLPEYEGAEPVVANVSEVLAAPTASLLSSPGRLALVALVVAVWWADGFPGVAGVGRYLAGDAKVGPD